MGYGYKIFSPVSRYDVTRSPGYDDDDNDYQIWVLNLKLKTSKQKKKQTMWSMPVLNHHAPYFFVKVLAIYLTVVQKER